MTTLIIKDPVCGKVLKPAEALHEVFAHRDYCFCSENCRIQFIVDPRRYLRKARKTTTVF